MGSRAPRPIRFYLYGHKWTIKFSSRDSEKRWALCDTYNGVITIYRSTWEDENRLRSTLLHEIFHAAFPDIDEAIVSSAAPPLTTAYFDALTEASRFRAAPSES